MGVGILSTSLGSDLMGKGVILPRDAREVCWVALATAGPWSEQRPAGREMQSVSGKQEASFPSQGRWAGAGKPTKVTGNPHVRMPLNLHRKPSGGSPEFNVVSAARCS